MSAQETITVGGISLSWRRNCIADARFVVHELVDESGAVIGKGMLREDAERDARHRILTAPRDAPLTIDEFRSIALIVPVVPGRKGVRGEGEKRFLVDDDAALHALRLEALRAYDATPADSRPDDRNGFPGQFVDALLGSCSDPGSTSIHLQSGPGIRPIVFVNMRSPAANMSVDGVMLAAYEIMYSDDEHCAPAP